MFDLASDQVAAVGLPLGVRLLDALGNRLLVVEEGGFDVEQVRVYEVIKP